MYYDSSGEPYAGMMFNYKLSGGAPINFVQDMVIQEEAQKVVMDIAEYRLDLQGGKVCIAGYADIFGYVQSGKV